MARAVKARKARAGAKPRLRGPLDGVRVLDLTQIVAGPFCTSMLANLGAEVVKLEPLGRGDELRWIGRYEGRDVHEDYFNANNYSKKSIGLNLKDAAQRRIAWALADKADILVENYAPGTAKRLGMGWSTLRRRNPRLVYCSISGFGQTGPSSHRLAMDPVIQAASGVMSVTGEPGGPPLQIGAPLADVISGMFAGYAVLGALYARQRDGRGRYVDVSMQAAMIATLGPRMGQTLQAGQSPEPLGNQNLLRAPSDVWATRDGVPVFIMVQNDRLWAPFCRAVEKPEWLNDPRFVNNVMRVKNRKLLNNMVAKRFAELKASQIIPALEREGVPFSRVCNYEEALADTQVVHRKLVKTVKHPKSGAIRVVGAPWIMSDTRVKVTAPPVLSQHTGEVLQSWLGWPAARAKKMQAELDAMAPV